MNYLNQALNYIRNRSGDHEYFIDEKGNWSKDASNINIAQNHPILTPALLFIGQLFSSGQFKLYEDADGAEVTEHWILDLLKNPNSYQTREDFMEALIFAQVAEGKVVIWQQTYPGFENPNELHILVKDAIEWPVSIQADPFYDFENTTESVKYTVDGVQREIPVKELVLFYDLPNGLTHNRVEVKSRLDGLKQTLVNTHDSLIAKNIILKTNGKELLSGEKGQTQMNPDEKHQAESFFSTQYGLAKNRLRALIVRGKLNWKSLHIALRDLGLDESVKVDGNLIYTALHIPKDILSLEAKKTTYNNFKESMVSYIQNDIQSKGNSFAAKLMKSFDVDGLTLTCSYEHLPVMQFVRIERYKSIQEQAKALDLLIAAGIPAELALDMCDFDKRIKLKPREDGKAKQGKKRKKLKLSYKKRNQA